MQSTKRKLLVEGIKSILNRDPTKDYFCQYNGRAYRFQDIDPERWAPKPTAKGIDREFKTHELFKIGHLLIHF